MGDDRCPGPVGDPAVYGRFPQGVRSYISELEMREEQFRKNSPNLEKMSQVSPLDRFPEAKHNPLDEIYHTDRGRIPRLQRTKISREGVDCMNATFVLIYCLAASDAGPAVKLNQPQAARPQTPTSVSVPRYFVGDIQHFEACPESVPVIKPVPDALLFVSEIPMPEFDEGETLQIDFEFASPESCHDSDVFLPAPPVETESPTPVKSSRAMPVWRLHLPTLGIQPAAACDEPVSAQPPAELNGNLDRLSHLRDAMQHLQAAGMPELAQQVSDAYHTQLLQRRSQLEFELRQTNEELRRLQEDPTAQQNVTQPVPSPLYERPALPSHVAPSSNVVPVPPEPMTAVPTPSVPRSRHVQLINPSFYLEPPAHVVEAWQRAFTPETAATQADPFYPRVATPLSELKPQPQPLRLVFPTPSSRGGLQLTPVEPKAVIPPAPASEPEVTPAPQPGVQTETDNEPVA